MPGLLDRLTGEGAFTRHMLVTLRQIADRMIEAGAPEALAATAIQGALWATIGFVNCQNNVSAFAERMPRSIGNVPASEQPRVESLMASFEFVDTDSVFDGLLERLLAGLERELASCAA